MKIFSPEKFQCLPDAVLFDTDNTLYPYEPAHLVAIEAVRVKFTKSFSVKPELFDQLFSQAKSETKIRLGKTASSHSRLLYFQKMLEMMGLGSQVLLALDYEQTYWRTFLTNAVLFDDVKIFLDELKNLNIPTVIITDLTAQIQFRKIVYFGLDHHFDYIVSSEEVGVDKPHWAPFDLALKKIDRINRTIWMIGDSYESDIVGSKSAIDAVTLMKIENNFNCTASQPDADCVFVHYASLIGLIEKVKRKCAY